MDKKNDFLDISQFTTLEQYLEAARARDIRLSTTFGWAVSNTMKKYNLTFIQACRELEQREYLLWGGNTPIIYLGGSDYWNLKNEEEETGQTDSKILSDTTSISQHSLYQPTSEIRCVFHTLVIRNAALDKKYTGGVKAFVDDHLCVYNNDITVMMVMAFSDLDQALNDIEMALLVYKEDFFLLSSAVGLMGGFDDGDTFPVPWLKVRYSHDGAMLVSMDSP
ncbi:hypothetical protein ACFLTW_01670 [Chloroflexota bacterium]